MSADDNQDYILGEGRPPAGSTYHSDMPAFPGEEGSNKADLNEFKVDAELGATFPAGTENYDDLPTYPERPHFNEHHLSMRPATQLIAFDGCPNDPYHPAAMPLYQTATFVQPSAEQFGPYDYTRSGNPTRTALETLVAGLENAHASFAFTSGMAALNAVVHLVQTGEEIIASADLYGGMYRLLTKVTARAGINIKFVDTSKFEEVQKSITEKTRIIHLESPSNPLMRISDLRRISKLAHEYGAYVTVDSTMMSPYLMRPLDLGVDIVIHSATKFLSGHSDVMAGVVCCADEKLSKEIAFFQNAEGTALAPFDCWLLLRSMKTLALRVARAQENAEKVAAFLARHPGVKRLHYSGPIPNPKRQGSVNWEENRFGLNYDVTGKEINVSMKKEAFDLHMTQSRGGGCVMSFETGNDEFSKRVVNACRLFKITVSFGSCNSLIEMPCALSHASIPAKERTLPTDLVRISVGIEDAMDIVEDLERAFRCAASNVENVRAVKAPYSIIAKTPIKDIKEN